jgi:hypothetical protein
MLRAGCAFLPPHDREDQLDEWLDEIECARERDLPVHRRTLSIVLIALPVMCVRNRWNSFKARVSR